jgi:putative flippase GtrA
MKKELILFLFAGCSAVLTDSLVYYLLFNNLGHNYSKGVSFISGSFVAFILNKFFTFKKHTLSSVEILKFCLLYLFTLFVNVTINAFVLKLEQKQLFVAFLVATGFSTVLNYIGQKFWVFKS